MKSSCDCILFHSKRNTVLLRDGVVEKHFASEEAAAFEAEALKRLHQAGVRVPNPVSCEGGMIKMPYIAGETLPDLLDRFERSSDRCAIQETAEGIVCWLGDFYRAVRADETGEIRGDVNGRNFLWDGRTCWGVDFEDRTIGRKEQDIGRVLAYIISYHPPKTSVKMSFADKLLREAVRALAVDPAEIFRYRDQEFAAMSVRRGTMKEENEC